MFGHARMQQAGMQQMMSNQMGYMNPGNMNQGNLSPANMIQGHHNNMPSEPRNIQGHHGQEFRARERSEPHDANNGTRDGLHQQNPVAPDDDRAWP
ncbi:hypothetical protein PFICI_04710 [Pestalotiopsis fici W106-1]|uniref:Uncharacterized protein n=1 Tax=Pestalotiopsis fici (strain W106-1 / CGMCC3.15140) TaxID=1229662 RepID=W3X9Y5_PESFW|nr:uncharacterized protein PFICI_04710 [Pestalotiopsis fici W106-1]ETS82834.1 hypothetical protein PFICI_04710 [Pestalotiopsis fici W106-1]